MERRRRKKVEFNIFTDDFRLKSKQYSGQQHTNNDLNKLEKPSDQKPQTVHKKK